nr:MAG TPA: hypothetical protein [Caudoviricetes sp.]
MYIRGAIWVSKGNNLQPIPKNAIQVKYEPFRGIYELGMLCKYIPLLCIIGLNLRYKTFFMLDI